MRLTILICLFAFKSFGQTSLPSSGPLSMHQIAVVMANLGEISPIYTEPGTPYSLSFLNGASHLTDKIAPFSISDWYGYSGPEIVYTYDLYAYELFSSLICASSSASPTLYSASASLIVGSEVYTDSSLEPLYKAGNGSYKFDSSSNSKVIIVIDGIVSEVRVCPF